MRKELHMSIVFMTFEARTNVTMLSSRYQVLKARLEPPQFKVKYYICRQNSVWKEEYFISFIGRKRRRRAVAYCDFMVIY